MRILLFLCFQIVPLSSFALTCGEVLNSKDSFSATQFLLKKRKAALLGRRYDPIAAARGGGSSSTKDWTEPESRVIQGFSLKQSKFEVSYLLDIIDPLPGNGSSTVAKRKISIQSEGRDGINYVYKAPEFSLVIPGEVFQVMAEMISMSRTDFHQGQTKFELSDEFIQRWFTFAVDFSYKSYQEKTLGYDALNTGFRWALDERIVREYRGRPEDYRKEIDEAYHRPMALMAKARTQGQFQQVITSLEVMVGRHHVESLYTNFAKAVVALLENPDAKEITEVTGDRQTVWSIDIMKIKKTFLLVANQYSEFASGRVLKEYHAHNHVPNLQTHIVDADHLLSEIKAYNNAILIGRSAKKNQAVLIALLFLKLKDQMDPKDFQDLVSTGHTRGRLQEEEMKRFNKMFPQVGEHFGLKDWESFRIIWKTMRFFPFSYQWLGL